MYLGNPIEAVAGGLYQALLKDLADIEYQEYLYEVPRPIPSKDMPAVQKIKKPELSKRRPRAEEVEVVLFPQTWGSTALGFGGVGGQAMTSAYTTVILHGIEAAVYFSGRFAYRIDHYNTLFREDMAAQNMAAVKDSGRYIKYDTQPEITE